jgi:hypothetical protein
MCVLLKHPGWGIEALGCCRLWAVVRVDARVGVPLSQVVKRMPLA